MQCAYLSPLKYILIIVTVLVVVMVVQAPLIPGQHPIGDGEKQRGKEGGKGGGLPAFTL